MEQIGFFDESKRLEKLSQLGDSMEKLNKLIDWSLFEGTLNRACQKEHKGAGGRPPYNYVLLFKILILQRLYNIADDESAYQINDRMSFMRFLGLHLGDSIPDATFVEAPRQRNTREENKQIKEDVIPEGWKKPENLAKLH